MAYERKTYDLFISDELKDILAEIQSESLVAQLLLKKRHDKDVLVDEPVNFISIAADKTKLSYLTPERIGAIDPSDYWRSSRRFAGKPGSFVSKIFKDIPAREVEKFSNLYRSQTNKPVFTFKVVDGNTIKRFYHVESYAQERGSLGASCMKHDGCQSYFDVYTENKDIVKMLTMLDTDGNLMGRALLWDFDGNKIMDRIYTTSDEDLLFHFKKWATENGYFYKSEQNWFNTLCFEQVGTPKKELELCIKVEGGIYRRYPYMDTFKFIDIENGYLYNYMPKDVEFRTLCSSDGSKYDHDYLRFDGIDRVLRYRGDSVYIDHLDIWTSNNNTVWSDVNDKYILKSLSVYNGKIDDNIYNEENSELNDKVRFEERVKYFEEREAERAKRVKKDEPRKSLRTISSSWLESMIGSITSDSLDPLSSDVIQDIYQNMISNTGIPPGYFGYQPSSQQSDEPTPVPEPEFDNPFQ